MRHLAFATTLAAMTWLAGSPTAAERPDLVLNDFEASTYGDWKTTGDAFAGGPAEGTLPNQMPVSGYDGRRLVNSYRGGDASTGTLTIPPFEIRRNHINFLVGGGDHETTAMNLLVDGEVVRSASGPPGGSETLAWRSWDVADFNGERFTPESDVLPSERGNNCYAA